ncbi:hypothetical protein C2I36_08235 [Rhodobacteraceae bacterium WD3A24]|nr:hypothetical protein C2I36_08235 [Rhodobacteraceae bacterium WD3A24]
MAPRLRSFSSHVSSGHWSRARGRDERKTVVGHGAGRAGGAGRWAGWALCAGLVASAPAPAHATGPAQLCERAAHGAARATGVPRDVLMAIALAETGRRNGESVRPWPWTVNMEGDGRWFSTAEEALAHAERRHAAGARSFDIGCFQINHRWHGEAFDSIEQMFEPAANARYAARFLARLHDELGSWEAAAGAYHSRTPALAERYAARVARYRRTLARDGASPPARPATPARPEARDGAAPRRARGLIRQASGPLLALGPTGARAAPRGGGDGPAIPGAGLGALPFGNLLARGGRGRPVTAEPLAGG